MTQNQNTALYAAVGGAVGFGATKLMKSTGKMKWALIIGGLVIGGYLGSKKATTPVVTVAATTTPATPAVK